MNNNMKHVLLLLFMVAYCISPIDACPGPVDDMIVLIAGYIANTKLIA